MGLIAGKMSSHLLRMLGRGSTLPGKIALQIDKDILQHLAQNYEIVVITGTNGKTLTTALTVGILQEAFGPIVTNPSGANMISGITTTFLNAKGSSGRPIAVLEIDEASLSRICDYITPTLFVITNIFRDQMDRYGEIYTTYRMILDGIKKAPQATVLMNGDSPLFHTLPLPNPVQYFGFETEKTAPQLAHYNTEGIVCPECHGILTYQLNTYANLGDYICESCGFHRPPLTVAVDELTELTNTSSHFKINGTNYHINIGGLYNIYNALAAVAVAHYFEVVADLSDLKEGQHEITLNIEGLPSGLTATIEPQRVTAKIGKKMTKKFDVSVTIPDKQIAPGWSLSHVTFSEDEVSVTSDQDTLAKIDHVEAIFPEGDLLNNTYTATVSMKAVDSEGNDLPVIISPSELYMKVELKQTSSSSSSTSSSSHNSN